MKTALAIVALTLLGAGYLVERAEGKSAGDEAAKGPPPGPPPPYQMRPVPPKGDRLAGGDPRQVFEVHCGYCHLAGGMGTNLLTKQQMMLGNPPEYGLLANRTDLVADYVKSVVRQGKNAMPPQTRVDITDAELEAVAGWLGRGK